MVWAVPLVPLLAGSALWLARPAVPAWRAEGAPRRALVGAAVTTALAMTVAAVAALVAGDVASYEVGGGLRLVAELGPIAGTVAVLVPVVGLAVVVYAAAHEDRRGLHRLVALLLVFLGAMELLVVAGDILTLLVGWELVGALSWALVGHEWRDASRPRRASHAFNATRFGGMGLFLAAGAGFAATGSLAFADWTALEPGAIDVVVAGVLLAAVSKSAQVPFAPWLFSAMAGPSSVSALLHSSTMVAAGAFAVARLHPLLDRADWFGPTAIAVGLVTALAAGVVGALQHDAKKLLAASTSAQYGLMFVAVGAGFPVVAIVHLVVHALFKAQLFLATGIAQEAVGSLELTRMRLGRRLRATAGLAVVGALSLAAVPPLAGGFSKEKIVTAATHEAVWLGLLVVAAGVLTAVYTARLFLLMFGRDLRRDPGPRDLAHLPSVTEHVALVVLAIPLLALSALWIPAVKDAAATMLSGELPSSKPWEIALSIASVAVAGYATYLADRGGRLAAVGSAGFQRAAAEWLGLPRLTRRVVVDPALRTAAAAAWFDDHILDRIADGAGRAGGRVAAVASRSDDRVVDAGVRGVAGLGDRVAAASAEIGERGVDGLVEFVARTVDRAGADARRLQTGLVHHQYIVIVVGLAAVVVAAVLGR